MRMRTLVGAAVLGAVAALFCLAGQSALAAGRGQPSDWQRFYYYPYVYYPHNFVRPKPSFNSLYYRYPPEMQIPVYNKSWYNYYPSKRPYYRGHHFILDVF